MVKFSVSPDLKYVLFAYDVKQVRSSVCVCVFVLIFIRTCSKSFRQVYTLITPLQPYPFFRVFLFFVLKVNIKVSVNQQK